MSISDVIARREFLAKKGNGYWYVKLTVTQPVRGITAVASTTRVAPPAYLARLPQSSWVTQPVRMGPITEVATYYSIDQYVNWLRSQVPIQQQEAKQEEQDKKIKEIVTDLVIAAVIIALPELLPEVQWIEGFASLSGIAVTVVGEGVGAAAAEEAMTFLIEKGYEAFTDISAGIMKKVIVEVTKTGVKYSAKECFLRETSPASVPALRSLERVHRFLWEVDPTYPQRYSDYQAELQKLQLVPKPQPVTTYPGGW